MTLKVKVNWQRGDFSLNADFQLPATGISVLFGRSGCGKSSLLRIIAGLERVVGAQVYFAGTRWQQDKHFIKLEQRRVGLVFQEASLLPHLSVQQNLLYGYQRTAPALRRLHLPQVLELLDIADLIKRQPEQLSGGQQQRVALGRALLASPQLLLLDEPFAALDSQTKAEIMPFIAELSRDTGVPILMISHNAREVQKLADRVVFMQNGRVTAVEPLQQALANMGSSLFDQSEAASVLLGQLGEVDQYGRVPFTAGQNCFWLAAVSAQRRTEFSSRLRVMARDVSLACGEVGQLSIQNQLSACIESITPYQQQLLVKLRLSDGQNLLAEITPYALAQLQLQPQQQVTALIKAVALID
ncbi:MAG: molybdenum ABC transporter ATP-binding protein [Alishewanella aestuarii]